MPTDGHGWERYYGLASIPGLGLAELGWIGTVPMLAVVGASIVTFGALSIVHATSDIGQGIS